MYDANNLNAIARGLIEDEPIREVSYRPAAETARRRFAEAAQVAYAGHMCQRLKTVHKLVEKTFCGIQPRLLFQIIKVTVDFSPCQGTNSKERHLNLG
jgi:hypothetical protein